MPALLDAAAGYYNRRELRQAERACTRILQLEPGQSQALHLMGLVKLARGDHRDARGWLERAVAARPSPEALVDLAAALTKNWELDDAIRCCREALAVAPELAEAHFNLGTALHWKRQFQAATESLQEAVRLNPDYLPARVNFGRSLLGIGNYPAAQRELEHVIAANPSHAGALLFYGISCHEQGQFDKAIGYYDRAHALKPTATDILGNMANAYRDVGNFARSAEIFEQVLALKPDYAEARNDYSHALLARGHFVRGWKLYEARWEANRWPDRATYAQPLWTGGSLAGKRLLVWGEQGIGDQMMFASMFPELLKFPASCTVVCEQKLMPLFARSFPAVHTIARRSREHEAACREPYDYQVPIASLGQYFRRSYAEFPRHSGYLRADPAKVAAWKARLAALGPGKKVAISWRGGFVGTRRHLRSIGIAEWLPILRTPGVEFISLQYTDCAEELAALREHHGIAPHHWQDVIDDYDETAALVCALDLVVSVCTSLVHLTGALGRPAWVLVPAVPEWRYMLAGDSMPWYPSVKLYRQDRIGEWNEVIGRVGALLKDFALQPAGLPVPAGG
ncbi:MAG: hypothetical protein A3I02_11745 [Betaproteobacteria bacterium RIFCSPLOWO2_02_FULL_67_26]|nr:MAG: hypothetical protein A3I02_11745 [Betaproteobacteria bacterium RIFCSPLOWO2_02_FULL_67_26]